ncbi:MAG: hypothetical protein ABIG63_07855 [Chloroflexota bacterium]
MSEPIDTEYRDYAICPYCGYEERDSWEIDLGPGPEGDGEADCGRCGETYLVSRQCTITYTTVKKGAATP